MFSRPRSLVLLAALMVAAAIAPAGAQMADAIDLGGGLSVQRRPTWCGATGVPIRCYAWEPTGFVFPAGPAVPALTFARTYAVVPTTGRILAALSNVTSPFMYTGFAVRMLRSDDRGATWVPVTWRWLETVALMAFEPGTARGTAAGDSGYVWTTEDGGTTWIDRGSSIGTTFTELAVAPRETVLVDSNGNVWRMSGGSFARDLLLTDTSAHLTNEGDAIVVRTATEEMRVRHGHGLDRHTIHH
jgi:hypothetical protein